MEEKRQDWKKIDEQIDAVKIREQAERRRKGMGLAMDMRANLAEERTEGSWRKTVSNNTHLTRFKAIVARVVGRDWGGRRG